MNVDIGFDANRTVYTFAGKPQAVLEAAYQAIKTASERIDMRVHKGEHPRMGACDVCPLIPLQNISMDEVVELSRQLGKRVADLGIPVYLYEYSATQEQRKNLAYLRKGEYEANEGKIKLAEWKPDFGNQQFNPSFGMMALGARKFLIAYNINLKTKDESIAKEIAKRIREIRTKNDGTYLSDLFQQVKAIGWFMEAFDCAQVSTNITDIEASPIVEVFTEIKKMAKENGLETNGSELIGLIPQKALQHEIMQLDEAIEYLGLNAVKPFSKEKNIIEYNLFHQ
jgi:glutamate formiminotransferase/formiminotetrahydrofolate cyclodeaminase